MTAILVQIIIVIIVAAVAFKLNELLTPDGKWKKAIYLIIVAIVAIFIIKLLYALLMIGTVL